ncbi:MAG: hypothetical protein M1829_000173 [Trizodia sp. TS-e1964]|nr:MAG: hypothetical protein M1829_000173 [Trizodia sp. TS-e1964]
MTDQIAQLSMADELGNSPANNNPPPPPLITCRPAYNLPSYPQAQMLPTAPRSSHIKFRHPAYPDSNNTLLFLSALDHPSRGLHYGTAIVACGIIAGNRFAGVHFRAERDGHPTEMDANQILLGKSYYFCVSNDMEEKYAIVPSFAHWPFPHGNLPASWLALPIPEMPEELHSRLDNVLNRDLSCRITGHVESTEQAHLVPKNESQWYNAQKMSEYGPRARVDSPSVDGLWNSILLRSDIHTLFDTRRFIIVPKNGKWVAHVLEPGFSKQFMHLYHNVELQPLRDIGLQQLFARFAWAIISYAKGFVEDGPRVLAVLGDSRTILTREFPADECAQLTKPNKSGSASPRKRKASQSVITEEELEDLDVPTELEEEDRGRKRRRVLEWLPTPDETSPDYFNQS